MSDEKKPINLIETADAMIWAQEFVRTKLDNGWSLEDIDESLMVGWFASAMQAAVWLQTATLEKRLAEAGWQPIETAPVGQRLLFWWSPIGDDKCAQDCVTGSLVYDLDSGERTGEWWNDQTGKYQDIIYLTHWMPLPPPPQENTHD